MSDQIKVGQVWYKESRRVLVYHLEESPYVSFVSLEEEDNFRDSVPAADFKRDYTFLEELSLRGIPKKEPYPWDVWEHNLGGQWVVGKVMRGALPELELLYFKGHGDKYQGQTRNCSVTELHDNYTFVKSLLHNESEWYNATNKKP